MNRIDQRFAELRARGAAAFIPYITAGDPTLAQTEAYVRALAEAGADVIELGVPFSDPIGDGVVNQEAAQRALRHGVTLRDILDSVRRIRQDCAVPLLLFTYYNPVLAYGVEALARDGHDAGVDGILCVDLPAEEADAYKAAMDAHGMRTVFLIAPTTTDARIPLIARQSSGFIYYVSRLGVTGERAALETDLQGAVARIRKHTDKPVAVGFGISTPEQALEVSAYADGVVVGSAIVRLIGALGEAPGAAAEVGAFARSLADAVKGAAQSA